MGTGTAVSSLQVKSGQQIRSGRAGGLSAADRNAAGRAAGREGGHPESLWSRRDLGGRLAGSVLRQTE